MVVNLVFMYEDGAGCYYNSTATGNYPDGTPITSDVRCIVFDAPCPPTEETILQMVFNTYGEENLEQVINGDIILYSIW